MGTIEGMFHDDITFCPEQCDRKDCMRNSKNIRDKTVPHSYYTKRPDECPKREIATGGRERMTEQKLDREKVIKGFTVCSEHGLLNGEDCHGYYEYTDNLADIIKANDYSKQCPYNGCRTGCVKTLAKDALALLKEQEAVKPVLDEQTGRIWLCGKCGSYVGFEDNDPHDPNEYDKYCRDCGTRVLWEGR